MDTNYTFSLDFNAEIKFRFMGITYWKTSKQVHVEERVGGSLVSFSKLVDLPGPIDLFLEGNLDRVTVSATVAGVPIHKYRLNINEQLKGNVFELPGFNKFGVKVDKFLLKIT